MQHCSRENTCEAFIDKVVSSLLPKLRDRFFSGSFEKESRESVSIESKLESLPRELMQAPLPLTKAIIAWRNKELQTSVSSSEVEWNPHSLGRKLASECTFASTCCQIVQECSANCLTGDFITCYTLSHHLPVFWFSFSHQFLLSTSRGSMAQLGRFCV